MDFKKRFPNLEFHDGASEALMSALNENTPGIPQDYCEFIMFSNGAVGFIGESFIVLWSVEEVIQLNETYEFHNNFPGLLCIGTNGGLEAYALDLRNGSKTKYGMIPFITTGYDDLVPCGNSFYEFIDFVRSQ